MNVKVETLPEVTSLSDGDVLVINKEGSFTGKVSLDVLKTYVLQEVIGALAYAGDNKTIGLSANNIFYVIPGGITYSLLSPSLQDQLSTVNQGGNQGTTLTGTIQTFNYPLTASGDFFVINVNDSYKALQVWNGATGP